MNRQEIEKLSLEELRLAIAKAKGWREIIGRIDNAALNNHEFYIRPDGSRTMYPESWPTSIADAWELVEEMGFRSLERLENFTYRVWYQPRPGAFSEYIDADTAPLAICRAWLMWKQAEK